MNDKFDELAKGLAQSVTRRAALKKFGVGFAGALGVALGFPNRAQADPRCKSDQDCPPHHVCEYVGSAGGYVCVHIKGSPY